MSRNARYSSLFTLPSNPLRCCVVGTGAVGRPLALMLASLMPDIDLTLVDPDLVDEENLGTQCWTPFDVGQPKVTVLAYSIQDLNPGATVHPIHAYFQQEMLGDSTSSADAVFMCVDDMDVRRQILDDAAAVGVPFLVDCRMGAEGAVCWPVDPCDPVSYQTYVDGWFPQSEAARLPCTSRSTNYAGHLAAVLAMNALVCHLRKERPRASRVELGPNPFISDPTDTRCFADD